MYDVVKMYRFFNVLRKLKFDYSEDKYKTSENKISFLNFYGGEWFQKFVEANFPDKKFYDLCFTSVNGKRTDLNRYPEKKIFWSGENVEHIIKHKLLTEEVDKGLYWWFNYLQKLYGDYRNHEVDLAMGYGEHEKEYQNYIRFPLWIIYLIKPNSTYSDIKNKIDEINKKKSSGIRDAVCMNKHDVFGVRSKICDDLQEILKIYYPGKWRHNDDDLWEKYDDNKNRYLNLFKFNICPENMDVPHYCTEKIFDAVSGGCIPVYAGCNNNPEPVCINKDFVIFWDLDDKNNTENKKMINKLMNNDDYYYKFMQQEKLKKETADYVMDRLILLKNRIGELL